MAATAVENPGPEGRRALNLLLDEAVISMGAERGAVFLLRAGGLEIGAARDCGGLDLPGHVRWSWPIVRKVVAEGRPIRATEDWCHPGPIEEHLAETIHPAICDILCVPIAASARVRGALLLDAHSGPGGFSFRRPSELDSFAARIVHALGDDAGP